MENLINITDKLVIKSLETKIFRLQNQVEFHLKNVEKFKTENFSLIAQNDRLLNEIDELKKLLKSLDVGITYG